MIILAEGLLQQHFWGTYCATIFLKFYSDDLAAAALPQFPRWIQSQKDPRYLYFHGGDPELSEVADHLVAHGADRAKLFSLKYSIDYGEPFVVEVDLTPAPPEQQLWLPGVPEPPKGETPCATSIKPTS